MNCIKFYKTLNKKGKENYMEIFGKIISVFSFMANRFKEPSSLAALSSVLALGGVQMEAGTLQDIATTASVVFGGLGVVMKENGGSA